MYHLNAVDTVTQWQVVGGTETISERHLIPVLEAMLHQFPFPILGFHCDNGSEFLNYKVVGLLKKLLVEEFTKSRACRSTDNALVEGKNGAVVRKQIGYGPIGCEHAEAFQKFYTAYLNPYLNFHRPCGYAIIETDLRAGANGSIATKTIERLREAHVTGGLERTLKGRDHRNHAEAAGRGTERHRSGAPNAESQTELVGALPENTMRRKRCGNAGAVESVESQRQASPSFHEPLGKLAKGGRDSHIPTAPATRADGKVENQKQVFRFPTAPRIDWERINKKPRRAAFALCPPKPTKHHERRLLPATWTTPFSGSCRIGIEESFQAHLPLESILDFRLICGLENAAMLKWCFTSQGATGKRVISN